MIAEEQPPTGLGWQLASFLEETLEARPAADLTGSALWGRYLAWCHARRLAPLAHAVFHGGIDEIAAAIGLERVQVNGHVHYTDVVLRSPPA